MTKNTKNFVLTIILAFALSLVLPWWAVMLAAFLSAFSIPLKKAAVFFVPFLAVALFWMAQSYVLSSANDFTLAEKIATLLPLNGNAMLLIVVTGLIGGLAAGIAGVFGKQCKELV